MTSIKTHKCTHELFGGLTVITAKDETLWFFANEVAEMLQYTRPAKAVSDHCKKPKEVMRPILGLKNVQGHKTIKLIPESDFYRLVLKSKMESAEKFQDWVVEEVLPSIRKNGSYAAIPKHRLRYHLNLNAVPIGYYSIMNVIYEKLYVLLENKGFILPDKTIEGRDLTPDISVGSTFCKWLRVNGHNQYLDEAKKYMHKYPDGRQVEARMYHADSYPLLINFMRDVWIPTKARAYFKKRVPKVLDVLPKLLKG